MKKIIFSTCIMLLSIIYCNAQTITITNQQVSNLIVTDNLNVYDKIEFKDVPEWVEKIEVTFNHEKGPSQLFTRLDIKSKKPIPLSPPRQVNYMEANYFFKNNDGTMQSIVICKTNFSTANARASESISGSRKNTVKYDIIYDGLNKSITYKKYKRNGVAKFKQSISPKVGSIIRVQVINISDKDSAKVTFQFEDRNLEDSETFTNVINGGMAPAPKSDKSDDNKERQNPNDPCSACHTKLKELKSKIYTDKFDSYAAATACVKSCAEEYINSNLMAAINKYNNAWDRYDKYEITYEELEEELNSINKKYFYKDSINKAFFTSDLIIKENIDSLLTYLNRPVHNQRPQISLVQVKNMDVINISITHYANGKKKMDFTSGYFNSLGVKIDFSTGIFFHGLVDDKYIMRKDTMETRDIDTVSQVSSDKFNMGFGVLSHIYFRTGSRFNASLTTGFLTDLEANIRFVGGGSLLLGSERRWVLSGGLIAGKRQVLDETYHNNQAIEGGLDAIPYVSKFDTSWFVGISYNLGGITTEKGK